MSHQVHLCRMLSFRIGPAFDTLVGDLKACGVEVGVAGCLGDCLNCQRAVIARVDGAPVTAPTPQDLVEQVRHALAG